jgi:phosphopantothenoylcysteine decarboxylase/phosphopantothenate--cysteine ligase
MGEELKSKRIGLCITGSVAAIKSPEIARELIDHGAAVVPIMTNGAQRLIQPELMRWATQNNVIITITGSLEHIRLTEDGPEKLDLIIIAPATANTIGKISTGISDTTVALLASCALGTDIPIIVAPSMHISLWRSPALKSNLDQLRNMGVEILDPILVRDKAKISPTEEIIESVIRRLNPKDMNGINVMVTAGPSQEHLDPIRILTNRSSGKMGYALAREAKRRGAEVTLISGPSLIKPPSSVEFIPVVSAKQMNSAVLSHLSKKKFDLFLAAAAPEDFRPQESKTKISSRVSKPYTIKFESTEKIIESVKKVQPEIFLISFKADWRLQKQLMITRGKEMMKQSSSDIVIMNDVSLKDLGFNSDKNKIIILKNDGSTINIPISHKQILARKILNIFLESSKESSN